MNPRISEFSPGDGNVTRALVCPLYCLWIAFSENIYGSLATISYSHEALLRICDEMSGHLSVIFELNCEDFVACLTCRYGGMGSRERDAHREPDMSQRGQHSNRWTRSGHPPGHESDATLQRQCKRRRHRGKCGGVLVKLLKDPTTLYLSGKYAVTTKQNRRSAEPNTVTT